LDQPVYKLLGGDREKVPAYASTMCGDDLENGLAAPQDYAVFAEWAMGRGYQGFSILGNLPKKAHPTPYEILRPVLPSEEIPLVQTFLVCLILRP